MLRYIAALTAVLLLSISLADSIGPRRDANLALINEACLVMSNQSKATSFAAKSMVTILLTDLEDKAVLYRIPVKNNCTANEANKLPTLLLYFDAAGPALLLQLDVLLPMLYAPAATNEPTGRPMYLSPTIWSDAWVTTHASTVTPQDVENQAASTFDAFALAWKKEHTK